MSSSEARIKGLAELQKVLEQLPAAVERNIMRGALRAGAKVFLREAQSRAPVAPPNERNARLYGGRRGLLRDSLRLSVGAKNGVITAKVVAGGKVKGGGIAYYAGWVEKGTKPHLIKAVHARALSIGTGSNRRWTTAVIQHPGARPNPFMTPTFDLSHRDALIAVREYVRRRLKTKHGVFVAGPEE
jgi:HK97 gp10 family phage protein